MVGLRGNWRETKHVDSQIVRQPLTGRKKGGPRSKSTGTVSSLPSKTERARLSPGKLSSYPPGRPRKRVQTRASGVIGSMFVDGMVGVLDVH